MPQLGGLDWKSGDGARTKRPELAAHCRLSAAIAWELACRLALSPEDRLLARDAALCHHHPPEVLDPNTLATLHREMADADSWPPAQKKLINPGHWREAAGLLHAFHSCSVRAGDERMSTLVDIVRTSNLFAEQLESPGAGEATRERTLEKLRDQAENGLCRPAIVRALSELPRIRPQDLLEIVARLPVYPGVALRVLGMVAGESVSFGQLDSLISSDQVLAGRLIRVANSCLYSPLKSISTITQAISYIGMEATRKVVTAVAFQPLFASANLRDLWRHSLEIARLSESLAGASGRFQPQEAFLAGLVHDVGCLAFCRMPGEPAAAYARMLEAGCTPHLAELFLFGFDHARLGEEVLRIWQFPEHLVAAVAHHHRPERDRFGLASIVYLAEQRAAPSEGTSSLDHLRHALDAASISPETLASADAEIGVLTSLVSAA